LIRFEAIPGFRAFERWTSVLLIGVALVLSMGAYYPAGPVKIINFFCYDQFLKFTARQDGGASEKILIVDIDEKSLSAVGQWPWPRYVLARLITELGMARPMAIGMDIIMAEPDRTALKSIRSQFQKDFGLSVGFTGVPAGLEDNDAYLAQTLKANGVVGARYFYFDHYNKQPVAVSAAITVEDPLHLLTLNQAAGVLANTQKIEAALPATGYINNRYDSDGLLRQTPVLMSFQDQIFTHLSVTTLLKAHGISKARIIKGGLGPVLKAGRFEIPVTADGFVNLRFNSGGGSHRYMSALDILNQDFNPSDIQDKVVFIGSSSVGLNDIHPTLMDPHFPGVEIQGVVLSAIFQDRQIIRPQWSATLVFWVCCLTGSIMTCLFLYGSAPGMLAMTSVAWCGLIIVASLALFARSSVFISPGLPVMSTIILFVLTTFGRFVWARRSLLVWFQKLAKSQQLTMEVLVSIMETRDPETGEHITRTQEYARALADHLKQEKRFPETLNDAYIELLYHSVPLHDIGKVGVPDNILMKPDRLTDEEFELMKLHAPYGRDALERAVRKNQGDNYLKLAAEIAGSHHERWDGKGYPDGLSGEEIPLSGRIMAICDVYDALISRRCYKPPFPHEKSMNIIKEGRGTQFDPRIVDGFVAIELQVCAIADKLRDPIENAPEPIKDNFMKKTEAKS